MNRKGTFNNQLTWNIAYLILFILFFSGMLFFVLRYQNGAAIWEEFYAVEIAKIIDTAEPGQEVYLDVSEGTNIALKSGMLREDLNEIIKIDNINNKVIVKLHPNFGTVYRYFSDVDVIDWKIEQVSGQIDKNRFTFRVIEGREDE